MAEQAVTRATDQFVIELFLNVCQFKNKAQKYILEVWREGGCVNSEHSVPGSTELTLHLEREAAGKAI